MVGWFCETGGEEGGGGDAAHARECGVAGLSDAKRLGTRSPALPTGAWGFWFAPAPPLQNNINTEPLLGIVFIGTCSSPYRIRMTPSEQVSRYM